MFRQFKDSEYDVAYSWWIRLSSLFVENIFRTQRHYSNFTSLHWLLTAKSALCNAFNLIGLSKSKEEFDCNRIKMSLWNDTFIKFVSWFCAKRWFSRKWFFFWNLVLNGLSKMMMTRKLNCVIEARWHGSRFSMQFLVSNPLFPQIGYLMTMKQPAPPTLVFFQSAIF